MTPKRIAPTLVAAAFAIAYVIISPPSLDLAAHLLRAKLFSAEGFGIWNNWWYAGHDVPGYSVLFPPIAALLTPQIAAGIATTGTAALFEPLARRHFGPDAWLGAVWFGAGTAMNLFTGRLTFAFGLLPAMAMALALQRRRTGLAVLMAVLSALASPVAALFAALAAGAYAIGRFAGDRELRAALPGGAVRRRRPAAGGDAVGGFPRGRKRAVHAGHPVAHPGHRTAGAVCHPAAGMDAARRGGPVCARVHRRLRHLDSGGEQRGTARAARCRAAGGADLVAAAGRLAGGGGAALALFPVAGADPGRPDLGRRPLGLGRLLPAAALVLGEPPGPPFRVEIPFTRFHWEAYQVAPRFPLARGWERQLDIKYNHLFYGGVLDAATYEAWLHQLAVRYVAVPDASLDFSAHREVALIDGGLPYLHLVFRSSHWRVYAVANPTPMVSPGATLDALGPNSVTIDAQRPGPVLVRVRFSPYWKLGQGTGCVAPAGQFTQLNLRRPGPVKLVIAFSIGRIGARSPRCT